MPAKTKLTLTLFLIISLGLFSGPILGQEKSSVKIFGGASYLRATDLGYPGRSVNTFGGVFSATIPVAGRFGIVAEFAVHHGRRKVTASDAAQLRVERTTFSYLFGPEVRLFRTGRLEVGARGLLGISRGEFVTPGVVEVLPGGPRFGPIRSWENSFTGSFGGTADLKLSERIDWRIVQPDLFVTRFGSGTQTDFRIATGIVIRFGKR